MRRRRTAAAADNVHQPIVKPLANQLRSCFWQLIIFR
jgi:hypothetical protein